MLRVFLGVSGNPACEKLYDVNAKSVLFWNAWSQKIRGNRSPTQSVISSLVITQTRGQMGPMCYAPSVPNSRYSSVLGPLNWKLVVEK